MMEAVPKRRVLFGLAWWFTCNSLLVVALTASLWLYFNDDATLKAIYWLLLAVPLSRMSNDHFINECATAESALSMTAK